MEGDAKPTADAISRTDGGNPLESNFSLITRRIARCRSLIERSVMGAPPGLVDADVHGWSSTGYVKFKPNRREMKHMFECASTFVSRRAIVQVFDEHVFDIVSLEVVMSVSFATKACRLVPGASLADAGGAGRAPGHGSRHFLGPLCASTHGGAARR